MKSFWKKFEKIVWKMEDLREEIEHELDRVEEYFNDKSEKRDFMNTHGIIENPSMESDRHRTNRLVDQINESREKQGLKPKTKSQLIGDARWRLLPC